MSIINDLGWNQCDLVGHSLGAGICSIFSATFPEKVNRLILIDGIGPVSHEDQKVLGQLRKAGSFYLGRKVDTGIASRGYASWDQLIDSRQSAGPLKTESAELLMRRAATERFGQVFVESDRRLKEPSFAYMSQGQVCHILSGIESPTLLIQALSGFIIERSTTLERIGSIADISVVNLPGNHHLHMDAPESVAHEIDQFLRSK